MNWIENLILIAQNDVDRNKALDEFIETVKNFF